MFIPYDIWQEVYVVENTTSNICLCKVSEIRVDSEWITIIVDGNMWTSFSKKIENVYPNKEEIKEALLKMILDRANNELSKK